MTQEQLHGAAICGLLFLIILALCLTGILVHDSCVKIRMRMNDSNIFKTVEEAQRDFD